MNQAGSNALPIRIINRKLIQLGIFIATAGLSFITLVLPIATRPSIYHIGVGDVAPQDIQAPSAISYVSQVQTNQLRDEAEQSVSPVFLPVDTGIARKQIELLRASLNFITNVRADSYATNEQKLSDLSAMENIQLNREEAGRILAMNDSRWETVEQEALTVLEQVMRNTIRDGHAQDAQRNVPTLISFTLTQDQALTVASLVTPFVVPNSLYSEDQTAAARKQARDSVKPVTRTFATGETIVRRGQIITPESYEALQQFGLIETSNNYRDIMAKAALVIVTFCLLGIYMVRRNMTILDGLRSLALVSVVFLFFLYFARLIIPNRTVIPYLYPIAAFGLTVSCLFSTELGLILSLVLSILSAYGLPNSMDLTIFFTISSMVGILLLGKGLHISSFFWAGIGLGAAGGAVILAYRLQDSVTDLIGIATLIGTSFLNGLASASLALIFQFLFAQVLGLATALQLLEISRPDHPLQQFILQNAPGSYQHSLQVSIMAEQAAEKIGADTLLVRVGAIYHDAGKALNPYFFIENQIPGKLNPHDDLDPAVSAQTIIRHVTDGVQLARKYHLPPKIIDFIQEHHGTLVTRYQYATAVKLAGNDPSKVDIQLFRYPGPRPQSRETALLMLADGCQARARAELPQGEDELRDLIRKVVSWREQEGQLDDTRLTLRDLNIITESFVKTLQNTYHPRIRYPEVNTSGMIGLVKPDQPQPELSDLPAVKQPDITHLDPNQGYQDLPEVNGENQPEIDTPQNINTTTL